MFNSNQTFIKDVTIKALNPWVLQYLMCFRGRDEHCVNEKIEMEHNGMEGFWQQDGKYLFMIN